MACGRKQRFPFLAHSISSSEDILIAEGLLTKLGAIRHERSWNNFYVIRRKEQMTSPKT